MKGGGTVLMQYNLWWHGLAPFFGRVWRRGQYCTGQFHIVAADLLEKDRCDRCDRSGRCDMISRIPKHELYFWY